MQNGTGVKASSHYRSPGRATAAERTAVTNAIKAALERHAPGILASLRRRSGVELVLITPEMAGDWLAVNLANRRIRDLRVVKLAQDIEQGHWQLNGETIKFSSDGVLLDGQHRLLAIIMANTPVESYVAFGMTPEAFKTIDTGIMRQGRDALHIMGEESPRDLAAAAGSLVRYLHDGGFMYGKSPTPQEIADAVDAAPGLRESVAVAQMVRRKLVGASVGVVAAMHYLTQDTKATAEEHHVFWRRVVDGVGLFADDPIYLLRDRLNRPASRIGLSGFTHAHETGVLIAKAWNAYRSGQRWRDPRSLRVTGKDATVIPALV